MDPALVREQTPAEFFREQVGAALARQHMRASDPTGSYLVNLLCQRVAANRPSPDDDEREALAVRLTRALALGGLEQRTRLRRLGDFALFMSGYFPDAMARRTVDLDYYQAVGECAYGSLAQAEPGHFADVFTELASKFVGFMDVLADVSERTRPAAGTDLLRLYERWLRTGSARDGRRLAGLGIAPNASTGGAWIQGGRRGPRAH